MSDSKQNRNTARATEAIPVFKVDMALGEDFLALMEEINESGTYSNFGPQVTRMESEFAEFVGLAPEHVVSTGNATLGIQGSMVVLAQDSWVLPSWTFAATAHAGLMATESILFGEIDEISWALEPSEVSKKSGAVLTAPFGAQLTIGAEWNHVGALVVDAAAAVASFPIFLPEFRQPWAVVVSLHATKILGIGEGGFVAFSSKEIAQTFRQWTNFGFLGSRESQFVSTNAKLSEVSAAIARLRLRRWPEEKNSWLQARWLVDQVAEEFDIKPKFASSTLISPYWIVEFRSHSDKLATMKSLERSRIGFRDWWSAGCHRMPAFRQIKSVGSLELTEDVAGRSLGLPFFRGITDRDVSRVRLAIEEAGV